MSLEKHKTLSNNKINCKYYKKKLSLYNYFNSYCLYGSHIEFFLCFFIRIIIINNINSNKKKY